MRELDLRRVDLNLLVALDALLDEKSVTGAARRLGMSQPAAGRALGRLRALFADTLLVDGRASPRRSTAGAAAELHSCSYPVISR